MPTNIKKPGMVFCDRCLQYWLPDKMSHVSIQEAGQATRRLEVCPQCMKTIREVVFMTKQA